MYRKVPSYKAFRNTTDAFCARSVDQMGRRWPQVPTFRARQEGCTVADMGAEPADPQFENLPDLTGIDLTPEWDDADPAHLDDLYDQEAYEGYDATSPVEDLDGADDFGFDL